MNAKEVVCGFLILTYNGVFTNPSFTFEEQIESVATVGLLLKVKNMKNAVIDNFNKIKNAEMSIFYNINIAILDKC